MFGARVCSIATRYISTRHTHTKKKQNKNKRTVCERARPAHIDKHLRKVFVWISDLPEKKLRSLSVAAADATVAVAIAVAAATTHQAAAYHSVNKCKDWCVSTINTHTVLTNPHRVVHLFEE